MFKDIKIYILLILLVIGFSCMDPVIEPEEKYSDYVFKEASKTLNNPADGFPNGSFENGFESWGGWADGKISLLNIDSALSDSTISATDGEKYLRVNAMDGGAGLYSYFSYTPGDTLVISFSYMIPPNLVITSSPAFGLGMRTNGTDADANYLEDSWVWYMTNNPSTGNRIIADGDWHTLSVECISSSIDAAGFYFRTWIWEWSKYDFNYAQERELIAYFDDFKIINKPCENPKPTDFSILYPRTGDQFNLDTITNFQSIPFSWEESIDSDTVLYTNRLVCKVPCTEALVSNGFEEYEEAQFFDTTSNDWVNYKMPNGYGTFGTNWFINQTDNKIEHNVWLSDSVARTGLHSLHMTGSDLETSSHHTSLSFRLSHVEQNLDKDRLLPGTIVTIKGYAMTPSSDRLKGENSANMYIMAYREGWAVSSSPIIDSRTQPNYWHPFEVNMTIPERRDWPNTTTAYMGFKYSQYNGAKGTVYFDDVTISTSIPVNYFVTDYFDVMTTLTSTMMSSNYLHTLFSYVKTDLTGITFSEVDFQWDIMATDYFREVLALNSPITFTVINESVSENTLLIEPGQESIEDLSFYETLYGNK